MAFHIIPGTTKSTRHDIPNKGTAWGQSSLSSQFHYAMPGQAATPLFVHGHIITKFSICVASRGLFPLRCMRHELGEALWLSRFSHGVLHLHVNDAASKSSSVQPCQFNMPVIEFHVVVKVQCNTAVQPLESVK